LNAKPVGRVVPRFADRTRRIAPSATLAAGAKATALARQGVDVVAFTVGEPDFDTPAHVSEAAIAGLRAGHTHYVPGAGIPALREAVAATEKRANGIPCEASNVLVTPSKHGIFLAISAIAQHGDEILIPDPAWVSYEPMIQWAHATSVPVAMSADGGYRMTPEAVAERITPRTRAIILNSPSNPTGGMNTPADVRGIMDLAIDHDLWVVSDEIYQHILYDGAKHLSPASLPGGFERTFTVNGLSKAFAMTGWRTGWVVAPKPAFAELDKLQSQSLTHITSFAMDGALAALTGPQDSVETMRREFDARRKLMVAGLRALPGVTLADPAGAFYAFPHFDAKVWGTADDVVLCDRLRCGGQGAHPVQLRDQPGPDHGRPHAPREDGQGRGLSRFGKVSAPCQNLDRVRQQPVTRTSASRRVMRSHSGRLATAGLSPANAPRCVRVAGPAGS
jgi:aspartate aminotransferase